MSIVTPGHVDAVVVGAGFGGLSAALSLAEQGVDVLLCESLSYAGGCASTFPRYGLKWEAGATLFSGFGEGQLFRTWIDRYDLRVQTAAQDPVMTYSVDGNRLEVPASRDAWARQLAGLPGAPTASLRAFFDDFGTAADALWDLLDNPELLPPLDGNALVRHTLRAPRYLRLARWVGKPLTALAEHHGVADFAPLRTWLDAACQITVQTSADRAEALFAMGAVDFLFRGVHSVQGGIGTLAQELVEAVEVAGGRVMMANSVQSVCQDLNGWTVRTRRGVVRAPVVVANVLPQVVGRWLGRPVRPELSERLEAGWGAVMLYLAIADHPDLPVTASHHQVIADADRPLIEGNHAMITIGEVQTNQRVRTVTISTHLPMNGEPHTRAQAVERVQQQLKHRFRERFPDLEVLMEMPASPRTFARFTSRPRGLVGGVPRDVGLHHYQALFDAPPARGLYLVGDSVFPGQSTLATAIGGQRVATRVLRDVGVLRERRLRQPA